MSCMCGDTHCSSCGPAQGNSRCPICRAWADDGCIHFDETTGDIKPEFSSELQAILEAERYADEAAAEEFEAEVKLAEEYWRNR